MTTATAATTNATAATATTATAATATTATAATATTTTAATAALATKNKSVRDTQYPLSVSDAFTCYIYIYINN